MIRIIVIIVMNKWMIIVSNDDNNLLSNLKYYVFIFNTKNSQVFNTKH